MTDAALRHNYRHRFCCGLFALLLASVAFGESAPRQSITVVMDDNYPPFVFKDDQDRLQGILIDQWRLWEERTGLEAQISAMDWGEALRRMRGGEFDVIDTIFKTPQRDQEFDFTKSYARLEVPIFFHKDIAGITDLDSLRGFAVAAKNGDAVADLLREHGIDTLLLFNSYESIVQAAKDQKVNVFVIDALPALYFLNKLGISNQFRRSAPINVGMFHRAVRTGDRALLSTLEQGFERIAPAELRRIDQKWYGAGVGGEGEGENVIQGLRYGAIAVLVLILALAIWNRSLSHVVDRRTAQLRASESRLRAILQAEPDSVEVIAADGRLLETNPAGLEMLEAASLQEVRRQPVVELVTPEHRDAFRDFHRRVLSGEIGRLEFEIEGLRGTRRWLATHATALRDEVAGTVTVLGVTRNITQRKKAQALIAGQMQVLEMIAAGAPLNETLTLLLRVVEAQSPDMLCSILLLDLDGMHIRHGAAPSLPREFTEAIDGSRIGPQVGSCGTAAFRGERVMVADIAEDPLWADYRQFALPHGLRACWSTPIFDPQHKVLGTFAIYYRQAGLPREEHLQLIERASHTATICINRYRTEQALKESEERFRQVMENIQEVFWMTTAGNTQVLYVSPAYEKVWGRSCASLYGSPENWREAIHPEDRARIGPDTAARQLLGDYVEEYRIVRPDRSVRWIRNRAFPIRNADGQVYRIAGVAEDITERRELEEQFQQSQKMEAIGRLAGGIAHDFNNVLSVMNGNAELALQDVGPQHPASQSLNEILKAGTRAKNLVQQILTFARVQQPQRSVVALASIVEETAGFVRVALPSTAQLLLSIAPDTPNVLANPTQIQQAFLNIFTNAWHALEDERGVIEVRLNRVHVEAQSTHSHLQLRPGVYACLSVRDSGRGMDQATRSRIFEPFFTTKPQGLGTGLGLTVAHGIVESHDGAIVVTSAVGEGTTFQLYFPAVVGAVERSISMPQIPAASGKGQHLLYLDDEEALVILTTRILERLGYTVSGFTQAQQALDAFRADPHRFDLAVTDFNMPGASGLDIAEEFMVIRPDISVVLISGYVTDDLKDRATRLGIRQVIYKPNSVNELCEAVQQVLREQAT